MGVEGGVLGLEEGFGEGWVRQGGFGGGMWRYKDKGLAACFPVNPPWALL